MTKIEQNEILKKVEDLNPADAKKLLLDLTKMLINDRDWQIERANQSRNKGLFDWAIAKEEVAFIEELNLKFIEEWDTSIF